MTCTDTTLRSFREQEQMRIDLNLNSAVAPEHALGTIAWYFFK